MLSDAAHSSFHYCPSLPTPEQMRTWKGNRVFNHDCESHSRISQHCESKGQREEKQETHSGHRHVGRKRGGVDITTSECQTTQQNRTRLMPHEGDLVSVLSGGGDTALPVLGKPAWWFMPIAEVLRKQAGGWPDGGQSRPNRDPVKRGKITTTTTTEKNLKP